jgi:FtsH-binding integral membrane protein
MFDLQRREQVTVSRAFLQQVFVWMFVGLLVTATVSLVVATNDALLDSAASLWAPAIH